VQNLHPQIYHAHGKKDRMLPQLPDVFRKKIYVEGSTYYKNDGGYDKRMGSEKG